MMVPAQALGARVGVAAEELRRVLVARREPALLRGLLLRARAPSWRWSPEELLRRLAVRPGGAAQRTHALSPRPRGANYVSQHRSEPVDMLVCDALARVTGGVGEPLQCRLDPSLFWQEHEELPEFLHDRRVQVHLDNSFVWVTSPGLRTSLHVSLGGCPFPLGLRSLVLVRSNPFLFVPTIYRSLTSTTDS
jgi:hypothetical protein